MTSTNPPETKFSARVMKNYEQLDMEKFADLAAAKAWGEEAVEESRGARCVIDGDGARWSGRPETTYDPATDTGTTAFVWRVGESGPGEPLSEPGPGPSATAAVHEYRRELYRRVRAGEHPATPDEMRAEIDRLRILLAEMIRHCDDNEDRECAEELMERVEATRNPETVQVISRAPGL